MIILTSILGGVLPIPGRVALSAPLLDAIAPPDKKKRSAFGIIDYLSTHHYYWWSPLEKTIILPMAALGITYREMLSYTFIGTILYLMIFRYKYRKCPYYTFYSEIRDDILLNSYEYNNVCFLLSFLTIFVKKFYNYEV